jgi:hypothetical protein
MGQDLSYPAMTLAANRPGPPGSVTGYGVTASAHQLHCNRFYLSVISNTATRRMIMALTAAEKQQRYRERHLGIDGAKLRIQLFVNVHSKAQLRRLARHYGYTVTKVIEQLAADAERALLDTLPRRQHTAYLESLQPHLASRLDSARRKARPTEKPANKRASTPSRSRRKVTL